MTEPARPAARLRLTDRDTQLLPAIGIARQLSFDQLCRLFFPDNHANVTRLRLRELCFPTLRFPSTLQLEPDFLEHNVGLAEVLTQLALAAKAPVPVRTGRVDSSHAGRVVSLLT